MFMDTGLGPQLSLEYVDYVKDRALWESYAPNDVAWPFRFTRGPQIEGNDWRYRQPHDQEWASVCRKWKADKWRQDALDNPRPAALESSGPIVQQRSAPAAQNTTSGTAVVGGTVRPAFASPEEAARRERIKKHHTSDLNCLDVWQYGTLVANDEGADQSKVELLWREVYGDDVEPVIAGCYFAVPVLEEFGDSFNRYHLQDTECFHNTGGSQPVSSQGGNIGQLYL
ncbi:hypothetical protein V8F06_006545 [Rhypophila decipiens]